MAPKHWGQPQAPKGLTDAHHEAVMTAFEVRYKGRDELFREAARAYLESWKAGQPDGYYNRSPGELLLATTVAVSIRLAS